MRLNQVGSEAVSEMEAGHQETRSWDRIALQAGTDALVRE